MKTILLVEDDPSVREICQDLLQSHGFEAILATNGMEGLNTYHERAAEIDLILSDIAMPIMDGLQMVQHIFKTAHPKVIIMSSHHPAVLPPADTLGLCTFLIKPFAPLTLLEAVEKCLA